jgi:carbamoylphosphate synthase small subunit
MYKMCKDYWPNVNKAGICRGGQLLNIMNGGKMYQHVDGHTSDHYMTEIASQRLIKVSSVHHQMMIPADNAEIVCIASTSKFKQRANQISNIKMNDPDPEVIYYPDDKALCFQGHPEYGPHECREYFFELLHKKFNLSSTAKVLDS